MNILNLIDNCISYYQKRMKIFRQHHYWNRIYKNYITEILGGGSLTTEQKREVNKVYGPYNHRNHTSHTFYTLATGSLLVILSSIKTSFIPLLTHITSVAHLQEIRSINIRSFLLKPPHP